MVECPRRSPVWPLVLYRHVRTGPIVEVHIMSGANYEDVQKYQSLLISSHYMLHKVLRVSKVMGRELVMRCY